MNKLNNIYTKLGLCIILIIFAINCSKRAQDFSVFVDAGRRVLLGQNIYLPPFFNGLQYFYSPLFAVLLSPFSKLPTFVPQFIWSCLSYFFIYRIWVISSGYFDTSRFTVTKKQLWVFITLFFATRFVRHDMAVVQMTIFLLWATLQSMEFFERDDNFKGAALLALAINVKLLPIAFVFYLLYRNKIKAASFTVFFYILYLYVPAFFLGWQQNAYLLSEWFHVINPVNKEWTIETEDGPSSLVALVPVLITKTTGVLSLKRNFIDLSYSQVALVLNVVRILFVLVIPLFLRTRPFKAISSKITQYWEMCYLFLLIPLLYPHQQQYAFTYIVPVFIYLCWYFIEHWVAIKSKTSYLIWFMLLIVGINFTPIIGRDVIGNHVFEILLYYRILTIAAILLIPLLWMCKPHEQVAAPALLKQEEEVA